MHIVLSYFNSIGAFRKKLVCCFLVQRLKIYYCSGHLFAILYSDSAAAAALAGKVANISSHFRFLARKSSPF
jgi:hypothetical protein